MEFDEYQKLAARTGYGPEKDMSFVLMIYALGLGGEIGEVLEKIKKLFRDKEGVLESEERDLIKKELGDVLWYLSELSRVLGVPLEEVASTNIKKLESRLERGTLKGSGDTR